MRSCLGARRAVQLLGSVGLQADVICVLRSSGFSPEVFLTKTYFITTSAYMRQSLFQTDENAQLLAATLLKYRDSGEFELHAFVVMPNHLHALLSLDAGKSVSRVVQLIKGGFSHALHRAGGARTVWQPGYYEHRVRDCEEYARIHRYILQNPVRRNLVDRASDYPYSSERGIWRLDEIPHGLKPSGLKVALTPA